MATAIHQNPTNMKRTDFYAMHKIIHRAAINELKQVVKNFGNRVYFGKPDEWNDDNEERDDALASQWAVHTERPIVTVHPKHFEHPQDVYVDSVVLDSKGDLFIWIEMVDAFCDPFEITPDEIEFGHVSFITDCIPDRDLS